MSEEILPHVTDIIQEAGLVDTTFFTDEARERGTRVHELTERYDAGVLDLDADVKEIAGDLWTRVDHYRRFTLEANPVILGVEVRVTHPTLRYCGRVDRVVELAGRMGVLDIKNGGPAPWHGVQLAAYARTYSTPMARWALYLTPERYKLVEYSNRADWSVFAAALTIHSWRRTNS